MLIRNRSRGRQSHASIGFDWLRSASIGFDRLRVAGHSNSPPMDHESLALSVVGA